jgi:hypothetical protein
LVVTTGPTRLGKATLAGSHIPMASQTRLAVLRRGKDRRTDGIGSVNRFTIAACAVGPV